MRNFPYTMPNRFTHFINFRFHFTLEAEKNKEEYYDPITYYRKNEYNHVPYQTTDIVYLQPLPDLSTELCYPPGE